jgi:hypothetical protein
LVHVAQQSGSGDLVQRDMEEGADDSAAAAEQDQGDTVAGEQEQGDSDSGEPVEQQGGGGRCRSDSTINRLIHNFTSIDFTVPRGCTATVTFSALWVSSTEGFAECGTGASTYTVTRNGGTPQRLPVGANNCETEHTPRVGRITMPGGRHLLRVSCDRLGVENISMALTLSIQIR